MKKILGFLKHPVFLGTLGVLALSALIWWASPMLGFGASRPFEPEWLRLTLIGILVVALLASIGWRIWKRKRANAALLQGMLQGPSAADKEAGVLNERFTQAVEVLKGSGGKKSVFQRGQFLYELPWYVFIGAPGSGKTTALLNAGLNFPLAEKLGQGGVRGVGGTRNCDWWFTDQAVLIDTAGRYTLQDSDSQVDAAAWDTFLSLLKKTRPRRPLNGVLLTVNLQDLLQQGPAERKDHAAKLRARIQELHAKLGVRPPVYVLVTKMDLLAGFNETFGNLAKEERDQVWGFTFPYDADSTADPLQHFGNEFEQLEHLLRGRLVERMENERDILRRTAIFSFPQQFSGLRELLGSFLEGVFSAGGKLEERPLLRGVYLTSGTQEGTPIDRVLGTLARSFGVERRLTETGAQRGKSFFLHRLLNEVVFAEQSLVGENRKLEARRNQLRIAAMAAMAVVGVAMLVGWTVSFVNNKSYVDGVLARMPELQKQVDALPVGGNADVTALPGVMSAVRAAAHPAGFAIEQPPFAYGLGLYQGAKLDAGARISYYRLQDRALVPRVVLRLEERLRTANRNDLEMAYEALKAYLMLYTPEHFDAESLKAWIMLDWDANLRRSLTPEQLADLETTLDDMLARGAPQPNVAMDAQLVAAVREMLAAYPLEYRVFSRLKRLDLGADLPEFSVAAAVGPNVGRVFMRTSGDPLTRGIPGLFTRDGYHTAFTGAVEDAVKQLADEEGWVLGVRSAGQASLKDQIERRDSEMSNRVRRLYLEEYIKLWDAYLADVRLIRLSSLDQSLQVAQLLAAPDSPLAAYLRGVARETRLVIEQRGEVNTTELDSELGDRIGGIKRGGRQIQILGRMASNVLGGGGAATGGPIEQMVDDHFAEIHRLVEGNPPPLNETLKLFNDVYVQLAAVDAAQKSRLPPPPPSGNAKIAASLQPEPIRSVLMSLYDSNDSQSRVAERQGLSSELKPITDFCTRAIAGRYPFASGSKADVLPDDFAQMFGVGGLMDDFYQRRLATLVDTGGARWTFRPLSDGSRPVGGEAIAEFQRAARIKEVFFRAGGKNPSFRVDIRALEMDPELQELQLDIDGQIVKFRAGDNTAATVQWPPARLASQIRLSAMPGGAPQVFDGSWALFRLFDRHEVVASPQPERFQVVINVDGRKARLEVIANSAFNPFRLREIQQFRCPGAL
jgi:type VI secretion system protein ImpL